RVSARWNCRPQVPEQVPRRHRSRTERAAPETSVVAASRHLRAAGVQSLTGCCLLAAGYFHFLFQPQRPPRVRFLADAPLFIALHHQRPNEHAAALAIDRDKRQVRAARELAPAGERLLRKDRKSTRL